jgi:cytochrome c553
MHSAPFSEMQVIMMSWVQCFLICCATAMAGLVHADTAGPDPSQLLAAGCFGCHGTDGQSRPGLAKLAGVPRSSLVQIMQDFKNDRRQGTLMNQLAKGYEDAEIEALAQYFSQQKP